MKIRNITEWITAGSAAFAVLFAARAWWLSRRAFRQQIVNELFQDYGTKEMHDAIAALYDTFQRKTKRRNFEAITWEEKRKWINYYKKEYQRDRRKKLHLQRRKVSTFYQRIAYFARGSHYVSRVVKEMWGGKNTPMVFDIIIPIETVAMPELLEHKRFEKEPRSDEYAYPMWLLWKFWKQGPGILLWRLRTFLSRTARHLWESLAMRPRNRHKRKSDVLGTGAPERRRGKRLSAPRGR